MDLKEALELIWKNKKYETKSETQTISHLNEEVAESLKALLRGDRVTAQAELEDALSCLFIAFKVLKIDPEEAVNRQVKKMVTEPQRTMHIYENRVEIRVGEEVKGGWAIWSEDELKEANKMAKEFKCKVIFEEENKFKEVLANAEI